MTITLGRFPGNAVMVVPGRVAAPSALLLAQLFTEAGLPAGALNVLPGDPVSLGAIVAQNPTIKSVTYCGNKQVRRARACLRACARACACVSRVITQADQDRAM